MTPAATESLVANTPTGHFAPDEADFEASITGIRTATARFITRAVFTTCGRNILPAPGGSHWNTEPLLP